MGTMPAGTDAVERNSSIRHRCAERRVDRHAQRGERCILDSLGISLLPD